MSSPLLPRQGSSSSSLLTRRQWSLSVVCGSIFLVCLVCQFVLFSNIFTAIDTIQTEERKMLRPAQDVAGEFISAPRASPTNETFRTKHTAIKVKSTPPTTTIPPTTAPPTPEPTTASPTTTAPPKTPTHFDQLFGFTTTFKSKFEDRNDRGIVMCMHNGIVPIGASLVEELRALGNTDPIQVYHCLGELSDSSKATLVTSDPLGLIETIDLCTILIQANKFIDGGNARQFQNFWLKPLALVYSVFNQVMLMDVDNIFVRDPSDLWSSDVYQDTGTLFFYDRVLDFSQFLNQDVPGGRTYIREFFKTFPYSDFGLVPSDPSPTMAASMVWNEHTAHEQDSSLVLIDKTRAGPTTLRVLWYLVTKKRFQDPITFSWGDKEAFWLSFELSQVPYRFSPWNCGVVSLPEDIELHPKTLCGSLAQFWPSTNPSDANLFYVNGAAVIEIHRRGDTANTKWSQRANELIAKIPKYVTPRHTRHTTTQARQGFDQTCLINEGAEDIDPKFQAAVESRIRKAEAIAKSIKW